MNSQNPTMRQLGVPLDSKAANELMTEREGTATKVLYQVKMAIGKLEKSGALAVDGLLNSDFRFFYLLDSHSNVILHQSRVNQLDCPRKRRCQ
jgi:hypothetical protein